MTEGEIKAQGLGDAGPSAADIQVDLAQPEPFSLSAGQQAFLDQLRAEFQRISGFKSSLGKPTSELKGLDGDVLEQLESNLSTEDQYIAVFVRECLYSLTCST